MNIISFTIINSNSVPKSLLRRANSQKYETFDLQGSLVALTSVRFFSFSVNWQLIVPLQTDSTALSPKFYFSSPSQAFNTLSSLLLNTTAELDGLLAILDPATYQNVSASHIFSTAAPSTAPTNSPSKLSATSFFLSLNGLLSSNILIASLCAGFLYIAMSISLCYCIAYQRHARKIRDNKSYVEEKVSALRNVVLEASSPPRDRSLLRNPATVSPATDLEFSTGILSGDYDNGKNRRGAAAKKTGAIAPEDLQSLCSQIEVLHEQNNSIRAEMKLNPRRMNQKIQSYLNTVKSAAGTEDLSIKERKRLQTYFYLLEREKRKLSEQKKAAAAKNKANDELSANNLKPDGNATLYSVVPMSP